MNLFRFLKKHLNAHFFIALMLSFSSFSIYENLGKSLSILAIIATILTYYLILSRRNFFLSLVNKKFHLINLALFIILTAAVYFIHPLIDENGFHFLGKSFGSSDCDDALEICSISLLNGEYPYAQKTFLDNPITPLPGAIFLAIPFHAIGNVAYQNIFWIFAFIYFSKFFLKSNLGLYSVLLFTLSPIFIYNLVCGNDYISNNLYLLLLAALIWLNLYKQKFNTLTLIIISFLLGIALSSRPNSLLILPALYLPIIKGFNRDVLIKGLFSAAISGITATALTLTFYFWNPEAFSPFHVMSRVSGESSKISLYVLVSLIAFLAFWSPLRQKYNSIHKTFGHIFILNSLFLILSCYNSEHNLVTALSNSSTFIIIFMFFGLFSVNPPNDRSTSHLT